MCSWLIEFKQFLARFFKTDSSRLFRSLSVKQLNGDLFVIVWVLAYVAFFCIHNLQASRQYSVHIDATDQLSCDLSEQVVAEMRHIFQIADGVDVVLESHCALATKETLSNLELTLDDAGIGYGHCLVISEKTDSSRHLR